MYIAHDTERALIGAAALVNTGLGGREWLPDVAALDAFLTEHDWSGRRDGTEAELRAVRSLRPRLRALWRSGSDRDAAQIVNALLREAKALPRLTEHGDWGWHLHVTADEDPLVHRMGAEAAMAFVDVIRVGDLDRLRHCAAPDCESVLIDLSRNRSRRYCDTGNCGNRANVAAYRARKAQAATQ
ncbi:CGNR zinc finger domain-containing protein [Rhodococcus sp. NPDC058514]|uniref:CGNR zinc finger domain-containing protein n=1 Tax=unclassified Rhodococcus (in: high G+C Gram-positive bacteria) TaxID=192944 RepID=UPI00364CA82D